MSKELDPVVIRDLSQGRIGKYAVSPGLTPQNSVAQSINVDFSEVIGVPIVRKGNTRVQTLGYPSTLGESYLNFAGTPQPVYTTNFLAQTFTVKTNKTVQLAILVRLTKVGTPGDVIVDLRTTSAGNPTAVVLQTHTIKAATISGTSVYTILLTPITLTAGTKYAIVLSSPTSTDASNCVTWSGDTVSPLVDGAGLASANSGTTWAAVSANYNFFFEVFVNDVATTFNQTPLGNYSGFVDGVPFSVVVFVNAVTGTGVIYYWDSNTGTYKISDSQSLSASAKNRFTVMNGRIFRANGVNAMTSSGDLGATWTTLDCITTDSVIPSLLWVSKNRMIASGYSGFKSRIYFSSIVEPNTSPFITWNTDPDDGDWIDVNPDDGGIITAFCDTSNLLVVFKTNAMYRLNTISKTVDSENIFNIGAISQEGVIKCLGVIYFYSRNGIYQTDGSFPQMISRIAVQDYLEKVLNVQAVYAGNDPFNVYFSIGNITLGFDSSHDRQLRNVVLKFSPRDQNWSIFTYSKRMGQFSYFQKLINDPTGDIMTSTQYNGDVGQINYEGGSDLVNADYGLAIPYELETQELEMGNRSHNKVISDKIVVYTNQGGNGQFLIKPSGSTSFDPLQITLNERVNVCSVINVEGEFFVFKWQGSALGLRPTLQGIYLPKVTDQGIVK